MSVRFRSRRRDAIASIEGGVAKNVRAAADHYRSALTKTLLKGPRTGRMYRVPGGTKRLYTASAPGEAPAPRTGRLANSFEVVPRTRFRVLVGSPLEYARFLEVGTRHIAPRPYFRRTFNEERPTLRRLLSRKVE